MCQLVITHQMHHDVRVPMTLPDGRFGRERSYANPLRTVHHACEIPCPLPGTLAIPGDDEAIVVPCGYHSCCVQLKKTERCAHPWPAAPQEDAAAAAAGSAGVWENPELCTYYTVVHRHERLKRLGAIALAAEHHHQQGGYGDYGSRLHDEDYYQPAWRQDLRELRWGFPAEAVGSGYGVDGACWAPRFLHAGTFYVGWERALFEEAERLYGYKEQTAAQEAHVRDLQTAIARDASMQTADAAASAARGRGDSPPLPPPPQLPPLVLRPPPPAWSTGVRLNPIRASADAMQFYMARARFLELDPAVKERQRLQNELLDQRAVVFGLLQWARDPCPGCFGD